MPSPTREQLSDSAFMKAISDIIGGEPLKFKTPFMDLLKRPKFRKSREVHAQRARKLRRRGEYVYFVRWEHGHCIYAWSGPPPKTFYWRIPPRPALRRGGKHD